MIYWLLLSTGLFAQAETFDIASFTPPAGWQRLDSNDVLVFTKTDKGLKTFCQIVLFKSRKSLGSPGYDYDAAWNDYVVPIAKPNSKPGTNTNYSPDGWTATTNAVPVEGQGGSMSMLLNVSGFKRSFNVLINVSGSNYNVELENSCPFSTLSHRPLKSPMCPIITPEWGISAIIVLLSLKPGRSKKGMDLSG